MTTPEQHYLEDPNLSLAWGKALQLTTAPGRRKVVPLIVSITGFDVNNRPLEVPEVRSTLDKLLEKHGKQSSHSVANTIFPESLWNPELPRARFFERYKRAFPRIQASSKLNHRGLYFERMTTGGVEGSENQLEFVLSTFTQRKGVRGSTLQAAIFDPKRDHSASAYLNFPCLQHVTFAPEGDGLCVNAFYATQYMVHRAYGNYLGLCHLGRFVAHELGRLPLRRVTCFAGIAELDPKITKTNVRPVLRAIELALSQSKAAEE